ncbi:hypothetical protein GCM10008090_30930 [Arenicella chitinivorans]|uniref:Histidine kinase/HSP90-like ATPase domain-containing protein n=1 Tax=Arenicella chitinivorans TaxID=1329800 RepID=A0A918S1N8_9GAMM|nr:ATP-binding protein [Arenicella chitinivorans]GHA19018.1 hypothetical protein GCM10008090_30930 [Arenicella chitinivorans]
MSETIYCPRNLHDVSAAGFINEIWRVKDVAHITLDFSNLGWVYPSGALGLAVGIRNITKQRFKKQLRTSVSGHRSNEACSYLQHFGFFKFVGIDAGNPVNSTYGNTNYIPIKSIQKSELEESENVLQVEIENRSNELVKILYPNSRDAYAADFLGYCMREIIRNVFEHSKAKECFMMAQKWADGFAEISISDEGIGIAESLSAAHNIANKRSAIRMALLPGISSEVAPLNEDRWQNSGFGLYVLSQLGKQLGGFSIVSNDVMLSLRNEQDQVIITPSKGTTVNLRVNTNDADYLPNIVKNVITKGEELAKTIPGARPMASKASKSLSIW